MWSSHCGIRFVFMKSSFWLARMVTKIKSESSSARDNWKVLQSVVCKVMLAVFVCYREDGRRTAFQNIVNVMQCDSGGSLSYQSHCVMPSSLTIFICHFIHLFCEQIPFIQHNRVLLLNLDHFNNCHLCACGSV